MFTALGLAVWFILGFMLENAVMAENALSADKTALVGNVFSTDVLPADAFPIRLVPVTVEEKTLRQLAEAGYGGVRFQVMLTSESISSRRISDADAYVGSLKTAVILARKQGLRVDLHFRLCPPVLDMQAVDKIRAILNSFSDGAVYSVTLSADVHLNWDVSDEEIKVALAALDSPAFYDAFLQTCGYSIRGILLSLWDVPHELTPELRARLKNLRENVNRTLTYLHQEKLMAPMRTWCYQHRVFLRYEPRVVHGAWCEMLTSQVDSARRSHQPSGMTDVLSAVLSAAHQEGRSLVGGVSDDPDEVLSRGVTQWIDTGKEPLHREKVLAVARCCAKSLNSKVSKNTGLLLPDFCDESQRLYLEKVYALYEGKADYITPEALETATYSVTQPRQTEIGPMKYRTVIKGK